MALRARHFSTSGFSIAEVLVALVITTVAIGIVTGLIGQVSNLGRSSRQIAAVLELRSKTSAISRNLDSWLSRMRSSVSTSGIYAACLPDPAAVNSNFECPSVDMSILSKDNELKVLAGSQLKIVSLPIVDIMGDKIAGTEQDPVYFDVDGRACETNKNCAFESVGYFLRTNDDTKSNPGNVRFVVKVKPIRSIASNIPQRTLYLPIEVGSEWNKPSRNAFGDALCATGTVKVGYLANGSPKCSKPYSASDVSCPDKSFLVGFGSDGKAQCKSIPSCIDGSLAMNSSSGELECSTTSPCDSGNVFLGYYSGSGKAICSNLQTSCSEGEVQIGLSQSSDPKIEAVCRKLPSCSDSQKLSYDGSQFFCENASVASACKSGEVVVGINTDGSAKCQIPERVPASTQVCKDDETMIGENDDGSPKCRAAPPIPPGTTRGYCAQNWGGMHEVIASHAPASFDYTVKDCGMNVGYPCHVGCSCPAGWSLIWTGTCGFGSCAGPVNERYFYTCIKI